MPILFISVGVTSVVLALLSLFWLLSSKSKKTKMLCCFFLALSLIEIFMCTYIYLQFIGFMEYAYICEIGGMLSLIMAIFFIFKSWRLGIKLPEENIENKRTVEDIRQWIRHIDV